MTKHGTLQHAKKYQDQINIRSKHIQKIYKNCGFVFCKQDGFVNKNINAVWWFEPHKVQS